MKPTIAIVVIALAACSAQGLDAGAARFEAEKLLAVVDGRAKNAAFADRVLQDKTSYERYFNQELRGALVAAPVNDPAFAPYKSCVDAGEALAKFAELRRIGGGQNDRSDSYRQPFWSSLNACKLALGN